MRNEWLTTEELRSRLWDEEETLLPAAFYALLEKWRKGDPQILIEDRHWKYAPATGTPGALARLYSLYHVCSAIQSHIHTNSMCRRIYCSDKFIELTKNLANIRR